jgi:hypothetical protein
MKITALSEPGFARIIMELIDERMQVMRETMTQIMEESPEHPEKLESLTYRYTELSVARDTLATMMRDHGEAL